MQSIQNLLKNFLLNARNIIPLTVLLLVLSGASGVLCQTQPVREKMLTVNYPPDKTVMEFDQLAVSLTVPPGSADLITVSVNHDEQIRIIPDNEFECFNTRLSVGNNMLEIAAIKAGRVVDEIYINVFRRSDLESIYMKPPSGFNKTAFHSKDWQQCTKCHTLAASGADRKPVDISAFPSENLKGAYDKATLDSTCYSCHKGMISYPFVHAPAAVWSCLSCHDQNAKPIYAVKKPDTKACFSCHFNKKEEWYAKKFLHGPFNVGKCAICHNPHASESPFELIKDTWDLCITCHIDKGSGLHVVKNFSQGSGYHPTRGKPDPSRPGHELSCASCHDPHASDMPRLERITYTSLFDFCKMCHGK